MTKNEFLEWRKRNGFTQAEAARRIGCSKRALQYWEKGIHPIPKYVTMAVAAVQYNLPPYGK